MTIELLAVWFFVLTLVLLLIPYVIYPLVGILIGGASKPAIDPELQRVSVLVPAHNEAPVIASKIENFKRLDYPQELLELVIADDGSSDGTAEAAQAVLDESPDERIQVIRLDNRSGKAATMNRLVESSSFSLMVFTDANVIMQSDSIKQLNRAMSLDQAGAATGEVRLVESGREFRYGELLYYWMERRIQSAESNLGSVMGVDGGMYMLRRELFEPLPADTILDDFTVSMKVIQAGKRVIYEPSAKANESGTPTASQEFKRRSRIAAGAVQLVGRGHFPRLTQPLLLLEFLSHKLLRWASPLLFMLLFASNLLIVDRSALFVWSFWIQIGLFSCFSLTYLIRPLRETTIGSVLYYFGLSQVAILVGTFKGFFNLQPPQWEKADRTIVLQRSREQA